MSERIIQFHAQWCGDGEVLAMRVLSQACFSIAIILTVLWR